MANERENSAATGASCATDATWHEIEKLVNAISARAASERSAGVFYRELLERTIQALAALAGAIWLRDPRGHFVLAEKVGFGHDAELDASVTGIAHDQLVEEVTRHQKARASFASSTLPNEIDVERTGGYLLLLGPVIRDGHVLAIVELFQRPGASPATQEGYLQLLTTVCEIASDFHRNRRLAELQQWQAASNERDRFGRTVHASLDLDATTYAICNEGRRLLGCDRLSVLTVAGRRCRTRAISGVDTVDRRANVVRNMERLARIVLATEEPFWNHGDSSDLPPLVEESLDRFLDESHARSVAVIPLRERAEGDQQRTSPPLGALVIEWFKAIADEEAERKSVDAIVGHAASALQHAIWKNSLPFRPLLRVVSGIRWLTKARQLPFTLLAALLLAAGIATLLFVPAELRIEARGELQPVVRRDLFAPADGQVDQVRVHHADPVLAGDLLLEMRRPEWELDFARVIGEMQTAAKQLDAVRAQRLRGDRSREESAEDAEQLAAKEGELKELLASLAEQKTILLQQKAQLSIASPIDGQVLTWRVTELLDSRPVQRGQTLMTVVDPNGPWQLELEVPDHHIGYVLGAQKRRRDALEVSYILATDPGTRYRGAVEQVAMSTTTDEQLRSTIRVTVKIDASEIPQRRPGATVVARIHCGEKPLGYVWLHDLIELVRMRFML